MRIGLSIETDAPGGAETMLLQLARELLARGHMVVAFGPSGGEGWLTARFADMGIDRMFIRTRGYMGTSKMVRELAAHLREQRLDVLHSHELTMSVLGALATRVVGCRHVMTMHGGSYYSAELRRLMALRVAAGLSDHTVAVSKSLRSILGDTLRLSSHAMAVVHNGVTVRTGSGDVIRSELGVAPGEILVVAVGNLYPVKGHAVLVDALSMVPCDARPVVAVAGTGSEEARLRDRIRTRGVENHVRLLGYRSDVPDLLAAADVYVMPSLSEGLPMAMIEAMLAGRPVLASDVGGIPELIPSAEFGVLVPPGDPTALKDALIRLAAAPELRARLGEAARRRAAAEFTAAAMAEQYLCLYEG